ncbi:MAG: DNA repair protein RadA [Spirochaetaceae bacterium]|nr:DNA repair protein RadA [Spirochaetaceae bacterium]
MKKQKALIFRCSSCGHEEAKWLGRCPSCGEWNTLVEEVAAAHISGGAKTERRIPQSFPLARVSVEDTTRLSSGIEELDRVLGGGIMRRSVTLVGGEPGIGKSTLLLQAAAAIPAKGRILYISGEESAGQIKLRADRLKLNYTNIEIFCSGVLPEIETVLNALHPILVIVDSAQTLYSPDLGSAPCTINQMKYCSFELINWVKDHDAALFLVAHITKDGLIAGPKTLEHMVDTVLYFEQTDAESRFLRASKNRFGSVDEIGIFTMSEKGLLPVEDPSLLFLVRRDNQLPPGIATASVLEGSRCLLVEIQALTVPAKGGISRVFSDKIDGARVSRVAATLEKNLALRLSDQDIYVNVAGGIRINEVGLDLALAAALYSARTGIPLPLRSAVSGELTLAAEVMPVKRLDGRLKAAAGLGFDFFAGPRAENISIPNGITFYAAKTLGEAIKALFAS